VAGIALVEFATRIAADRIPSSGMCNAETGAVHDGPRNGVVGLPG
jgi:hypothetical protein